MSERVQTRSEAPRATELNVNPDPIAVIWTFFNSEKLDFKPLFIYIPRELFFGVSQECLTLFMKKLKKEFNFRAKECSIEFWRVCSVPFLPLASAETSQPKNKLPLRSAKNDWKKFADSASFKKTFASIFLPQSFSKYLDLDENEGDKCLHLVVTASGFYNKGRDRVYDLPEFSRYEKIVHTIGHTPSEGAKPQNYDVVQKTHGEAIHDGRYPPDATFSTVAPPIHIYHPIFDEFLRLIEDDDLQPSIDDLCKTQELMIFLGRIFPSEKSRNEVILEHLQELLHIELEIKSEMDSDETQSGSIIEFGGFIVFLNEQKGELGEGDSDPSTQAGISYRRSCTFEYSHIRNMSCCPVFLLAGGGPWLCVMGAVMPDKVIVQRLTDMKWAGLSSTEEDKRVYQTARIFLALKECILKLKAYYTGLQTTSTSKFINDEPHPRYYPYPQSFPSKEHMIKFEYLCALEQDSACVTFKAQVSKDSPLLASKEIVVKFVARYGAAAHDLLAKHGHAPELYYYGPLPLSPGYKKRLEGISGPSHKAPAGLCLRSDIMYMVVMEYIKHDPPDRIPKSCREEIETILEMLHCEGYAFGDLRTQNILLESSTTGKVKVKLIDFNWCGPYNVSETTDEGLPDNMQKKWKDIQKRFIELEKDRSPYAHYPLSLAMGSIDWHKDVGRLKPILPAHDWEMVNKLNWAD